MWRGVDYGASMARFQSAAQNGLGTDDSNTAMVRVRPNALTMVFKADCACFHGTRADSGWRSSPHSRSSRKNLPWAIRLCSEWTWRLHTIVVGDWHADCPSWMLANFPRARTRLP